MTDNSHDHLLSISELLMFTYSNWSRGAVIVKKQKIQIVKYSILLSCMLCSKDNLGKRRQRVAKIEQEKEREDYGRGRGSVFP